MHTVLLVEDDPPTREHLAQAIVDHAQLELCGAAATLADGQRRLAESTPDVLLTDLGLPDGSGIELIRAARALDPAPLPMVITVFGDERSVITALEAGAIGYLLKDGNAEQIGGAVMELIGGGAPISPPIARYLLRRFQPQPSAPPTHAEPPPQLTAREHEVLSLIAKGFSFPEIAGLLKISAHTVTTHVRHIYRKLEVGSKNAAVYEAVQLGLLRLDE